MPMCEESRGASSCLGAARACCSQAVPLPSGAEAIKAEAARAPAAAPLTHTGADSQSNDKLASVK
eukprot:5842061-Pleurochrysis_carterae.AAC.3